MNFKLEEIDGFEEETPLELEEEKDDDFTDEKEFDPLGVDDRDDDEAPDTPVYEPDDPEEPEESDNDIDEEDDASSALVLEPEQIEVPAFNAQEENNFAYSEAVRAYYEEKNYEQAIEKFDEAIKNERKQLRGKKVVSNEIIAKSLYWQGESYVKTHDFSKAIKTFETLAKTCKEHYLTLSAQRRVEILKAKHS